MMIICYEDWILDWNGMSLVLERKCIYLLKKGILDWDNSNLHKIIGQSDTSDNPSIHFRRFSQLFGEIFCFPADFNLFFDF